jgi:hypothetical protein
MPIESITETNNAPDGYTLRVQIFVSVIQATPAEAVEQSWSAVVDESGNINFDN